MSEHARMYRSFSGTLFAFFLAVFLVGAIGMVIVMVAMAGRVVT